MWHEDSRVQARGEGADEADRLCVVRAMTYVSLGGGQVGGFGLRAVRVMAFVCGAGVQADGPRSF